MIRKVSVLVIATILLAVELDPVSAGCGCEKNDNKPSDSRRQRNLVEIDDRAALEETCRYVDYDVVVYAFPGPHYVLGGIPSGSSLAYTSDCPKLGFDSINGVKTLLKGDDDNDNGVVRFDLDTDRPYQLHDVLKVFDDAEPNAADDFDLEYNSCVHFILRMIRPLSIPETNEFGDFLVDTLLADDNFLDLARKNHGGTAAMAARVLGAEVFRDYIENLVFSQLNIPDGRNLRHGADEMIAEVAEFDASLYGIETAFNTDTKDGARNRRLLDEVCYNELYDVDLIIEEDSVAIMLEPTQNATQLGCKYHWLDATIDHNSDLTKESFKMNDIFQLHDQLSDVHGTIMTMGTFRLGSVKNAYESASVCAAGHDGEGLDFLSNNLGDFIANMLMILGHRSSHIETMLIAAALMLSTPGMAAYIRANVNDPSFNEKSDEEVVEWFVEQRTEKMYGV